MEGIGSEVVDSGGNSALGDPAPRLTHSGQLPEGREDKPEVTLWVIRNSRGFENQVDSRLRRRRRNESMIWC